MTDREVLRRRIEQVYLAFHPDAGSAHGAIAWFARRCFVHPNSVSRWLSGLRKPGGAVLALLEELERQANVEEET